MLEFDNKKLNIIIGICVIVISIIIMFSYSKIKTSESSLNNNSYKVLVANVTGIKKNQPVDIGGYPVGFVKEIYLDGYSPLLILDIDKNIKITDDAKIQISNISLFSSNKFVSIINGINDEDILTNNSYITDSNLGVDLDKLLNMIQIYLQTKNK